MIRGWLSLSIGICIVDRPKVLSRGRIVTQKTKITFLRLAIVAAITAYAALLRDASAAGPLPGAGIKAMPVLLMVTLVLILAEGHGSYTRLINNKIGTELSTKALSPPPRCVVPPPSAPASRIVRCPLARHPESHSRIWLWRQSPLLYKRGREGHQTVVFHPYDHLDGK